MRFSVLGPLDIHVDGRPVAVPGARTRAVLAMLLARPNAVVPADQITDELWPGQPGERAAHSLQVRLSQLRRALRAAGDDGRILTRPPGYVMLVGEEELDAARFERLSAQGSAALAAGEPAAASRLLAEALALWRGPAYADLDNVPFAAAEAARLEEARLAAVELRIEARLACGEHRELVGELERLTADHRLRERLWYHRLLALYRSGRQADALSAYRELRVRLTGELGIEPGPELRDLQVRILRQDAALGYRPAGRTASARPGRPETRYVRSGGLHIAYQVVGAGERDIVVVPGLMSHLELLWEDEETADFYRRFAAYGRLILFDKRDTGLSDRSPADSSLEERMDDVRAVMRAAGSARAVLFGYSEGAPMSLLFAATYPDRVSALILGSGSARWSPAPGYPCGQNSGDMFEALEDIAAHRWGQGDCIDWYLPSQAGSPAARQAVGRFERMAISPAAFLRMIRMIRQIDVRAVLPAIGVPTLVIQRLADRISPPCHGRYLAQHIAGARYFEQPGDHSLRFASSGDNDALFAQVASFLSGVASPGPPDRVLASILVLTGPADAATFRQVVSSCGGHPIGSGGLVGNFDGPGQAIRCGIALRDQAGATGMQVMIGIHTGEVERAGDRAGGITAGIASDVAAIASPGQVLVSRTVKDLVVGSGIVFTSCGSHDLGRHDLDPSLGTAGSWELFAVTGLPDWGAA